MTLIWTAVSAGAAFALKLWRREPLIPAIAGSVIAGICVIVALCVGQARAFFLLPAIILPIAIALACVATVCVRRPLAGLILNKLAGGPPQWWQFRELRRTYSNATWACFAVNGVNGVLQTILYQGGQVVLLGVMHVITPMVFSIIIGVTVFYAKRCSGLVPSPPGPPS